MTKQASRTKEAPTTKKRKYLSQEDVPGSSLENALRVPRAISENYAGGPVTPLQLDNTLNMSPSSGPFRSLCGASIAYVQTNNKKKTQQNKHQPQNKRNKKPQEE